MKQLLQDLMNGKTEVANVPCPTPAKGTVVIASTCSLISSGTERMLVNFGKASLFEKARQQPEKVKDVLQKVLTDGLVATYEAVTSKLSQPLPLGYSNVGIVIDRADDVSEFRIGDRVVSNGAHAEVVRVPKNLVAKIPDGVADESASFTVLGSIGLQGVRLAAPTLGEVFAVTGVGVIGLLTVQLLRANGCRVIAIDYDSKKLRIASEFGAVPCDLSKGDDPLLIAAGVTGGRGLDGVLITAATKSSEPVEQAAQMCRKRGRIVLVGVTGLTLNRADFYEKELTFQVSCSYGPGRYDPTYEAMGVDYPIGFVRWTEQRNFEAILALMSEGVIRTDALVSQAFDVDDAPQAYNLLSTDPNALGILIKYKSDIVQRRQTIIAVSSQPIPAGSKAVIGVIGSGNFSARVLVPALEKTGAELHTLASSGVTSAAAVARKHGFRFVASDIDSVLTNESINTVFIVTRHDSHAALVASALDNGKHVFLEKPLTIDLPGLEVVKEAFERQATKRLGGAPQLMVGFNRRFSPLTIKMKSLIAKLDEPKSIVMTVNAGAVPAGHWTNQRDVGGGRIIGEACHFIDLMRFLVGASIEAFQVSDLRPRGSMVAEDNATISLAFADGSIGSINYFSNGSKSFDKERIEVFCAGRVLQNNNFIELKGFGWPSFSKQRLWRQDKGHNAGMSAFVAAVNSGIPAIPTAELFEVAKVSIDIAQSIRQR